MDLFDTNLAPFEDDQLGQRTCLSLSCCRAVTYIKRGIICFPIDTCRICSGPAEPDEPLFHPCKCSGTIRYIHQEWYVILRALITTPGSHMLLTRLASYTVSQRGFNIARKRTAMFVRQNMVSRTVCCFDPYFGAPIAH